MKNSSNKRICLIYSHSIKQIMAMMHWSNQNKETLSRYPLIGIKRLNDDVFSLLSGLKVDIIECVDCSTKMSEDRNENRELVFISKMILKDEIKILIFFTKSDELYSNNITEALINTALNKNIYFALNKRTADFMITSELINAQHNQNVNHVLQSNESPKTIALIAHDGAPKRDITNLCAEYIDVLSSPNIKLVGTSKTAEKINQKLPNLKIEPLGHGPDGGDIVISEKIYKGEIDIMFFFIDTMDFKPHYREIGTLIDTAVDTNIAFALNTNTASAILCSPELFKKR